MPVEDCAVAVDDEASGGKVALHVPEDRRWVTVSRGARVLRLP
jgi:hypothetical protein